MAKAKLLKNAAWFEDGEMVGGSAGQVLEVGEETLKRNPDWFEVAEETGPEPEPKPEPEVVDTQQEPAANTQVKRVRRRRK